MKKLMRTKFLGLIVVVIVFSLYSCGNTSLRIPASKRPAISVKIKRYGTALFSLDTLNFKVSAERLKKQFPFFLDADLNNKANYQQLYGFVTDTAIIHVYHKTREVFPNLDELQKSLSSEFSYIKYYFPHYRLPQVYSYVSDLYFEQPIMKKDSVLVIALDDYLGENYLQYKQLNIPLYHRRLMKPEYIPVDVAKYLYIHDFSHSFQPQTLLDNMIQAGKMLYFMDAVLPETPDSLKMGYTHEQWQWMEQHKKEVWAVMVNDQMLFSGDFMVIKKMMQQGPFTDGFPRTAPSSMGAWFGWQMVKKYMQRHPKTTLSQLLKMKDSQQLLQESGYKP
ncbi:MAG: hypothetical protein JXR71_11075 [Bacteroidales bacterium]|nr:hypothetical protein [Bacteroidales bacterium]